MACPICAKAADVAYRPFCSRRCANVDLGRWLTGSYAIAGEVATEGDQAEMPDHVAPSLSRQPDRKQ